MIVVSNSSPLISLAKIGHFSLFKKLFRAINISLEVYEEIVAKGKKLPGFQEVTEAKWIAKKKIKDKVGARRFQNFYNLGKGEAATIILAKEMNADLVIIDERRARIVALSENLNLMGTLGVLELSFKKRLITDLPGLYQRLKRGNIRIDENLLKESLKRSGFKKFKTF